jgi:hypothetical protein
MIISQTVGLLGRVISLSQGFYLNTGQHKRRINIYTYQTSMPCVGFEPTIPTSERAKTVHALDRSATVTVSLFLWNLKIHHRSQYLAVGPWEPTESGIEFKSSHPSSPGNILVMLSVHLLLGLPNGFSFRFFNVMYVTLLAGAFYLLWDYEHCTTRLVLYWPSSDGNEVQKH